MQEKALAEPAWNYYKCKNPKCGKVVVTVDVDNGTTPMMLACPENRCGHKMMSAGYPELTKWPLSAQKTAEGEWYRVGPWERKKLKKKFPALHSHVMAGGLILRKATQERKFPVGFAAQTEELNNAANGEG